MPELPEVETVRRGVHEVAVGRTIGEVNATGARTVRRTSAALVEAGLTGRTVVGTGRHGKWFWLDLDDEARALIHLRMSGQLLWLPTASERPKHTHVALPFVDGGELLFVDPRTFGEVMVVPPFVDHMAIINQGPDALSVTPETLVGLLKGHHRQLKAMLLDQKVIAGLGNIYAAEALWRARISPRAIASSISKARLVRLVDAIRGVLSDENRPPGRYTDTENRHRFAVYDREGEPCPRCGTLIKRIIQAGRSTYYCPKCQRS